MSAKQKEGQREGETEREIKSLAQKMGFGNMGMNDRN